MSNTELLRKTKAATAAFNAYKSALRQKGHKISGEIDLARLSGLSGWEETLKKEWLNAMRECELEADAPTQMELGLDGAEDANPLNLIVGYSYEHRDPETDELKPFVFQGFTAADDLYQFYNPNHGGMRVSTTYVKESFNLVGTAAELPNDFAKAVEFGTWDSGEKFLVKRVSAGRFQELLNNNSSKTLAKRAPTAVSIEMISDQSYVVVDAQDERDPENARILAAPCRPATNEEKGPGTFKCGKQKYKLADESAKIIIRMVSLEVAVATPDESSPEQSDPLAWVTEQIDRGFVTEDGGNKFIDLAPRSFEALRIQMGIEDSAESVYISDRDVTARNQFGGMEIDGYEEHEASAAVVDAPAAAVALEAVETEAAATPAAVATSEATDEAEGFKLTVAGPVDHTDWDAAVLHRTPTITFDEVYQASASAEPIAFSVEVYSDIERHRDLFLMVPVADNPVYAPMAFLSDGQEFTASHKSYSEWARILFGRIVDLRLSE
jgi:hypothetical protein